MRGVLPLLLLITLLCNDTPAIALRVAEADDLFAASFDEDGLRFLGVADGASRFRAYDGPRLTGSAEPCKPSEDVTGEAASGRCVELRLVLQGMGP